MFIVGNYYTYAGDVNCPYFTTNFGCDNVYAENGFTMRLGNSNIEYKKDIMTPVKGMECKCIVADPPILEVKKVVSPLLTDDAAAKQLDIIKRTLSVLGYGDSDLEASTIMEVVVPFHNRNKSISFSEVVENLTSYLKGNLESMYSGSVHGYASHEKTLSNVLTVLFGSEASNAMMKLKGVKQLRVEFDGNKFKAYCEDSEITEFLEAVRLVMSEIPNVAQSFLNAASKM